MHYSTLTLDFDGPLAVLTLNRPDKRNAISYELIDDILRALQEVEQSPAQILILTGAGKAFCSGMDLDNLRSITGRTEEENLADSGTMARLFRTLYEFPKVTIAAVNGAAVAGGCGLATLCDFTLASSEAKFGYTRSALASSRRSSRPSCCARSARSMRATCCSPVESLAPKRPSAWGWSTRLLRPRNFSDEHAIWRPAC